MAKTTRKQRTNLLLTEREVVRLMAGAYLAGQRGAWPIQLGSDAERMVLSAMIVAHQPSTDLRAALNDPIESGFTRGGEMWDTWQTLQRNPFAAAFGMIFAPGGIGATKPEEKVP